MQPAAPSRPFKYSRNTISRYNTVLLYYLLSYTMCPSQHKSITAASLHTVTLFSQPCQWVSYKRNTSLPHTLDLVDSLINQNWFRDRSCIICFISDISRECKYIMYGRVFKMYPLLSTYKYILTFLPTFINKQHFNEHKPFLFKHTFVIVE